MRYDKPIYFQKVLSGEYDANTGDYGADSVEETREYASIMDTGTETMNVVYGTLKQGSKTVQLLRPHTKPFDFIRIGNRRYQVDFSRETSTKQIFVVSEVQ